jgi:predicted outer membrane repeat protein
VIIKGTTIVNNTAATSGGAINLNAFSGVMTATGSTITTNVSGMTGGGIAFKYGTGPFTWTIRSSPAIRLLTATATPPR